VNDRIYGYETEYAVVLSPEETGEHYRSYDRAETGKEHGIPSVLKRAAVYDYLEYLISSQMKVLSASYRKRGIFLENGGLFNYEALHSNYFEGLVEMATPECRSAREVAMYHAAQNSLLCNVAEEFRGDLKKVVPSFAGSVLIGKSSVDSRGTCIGTHENYLVNDDPGFFSSLILALVVPLFWILHLALMVLSFLPVVVLTPILLLTALMLAVLGGFLSSFRRTEKIGSTIRNANSFLLSDDFLVNYFGRFQAEFSRYLFLPWIHLYSWMVNPFVFRRVKRELLGFLVTRTIYAST